MNMLERYDIKEDPRFARARKEALWILLLVIVDTVWTFGFAYWGTTSDPSDYTYVMGVPTWLLLASIGALVLYPLTGILLALSIKNTHLGAADDDTDN